MAHRRRQEGPGADEDQDQSRVLRVRTRRHEAGDPQDRAVEDNLGDFVAIRCVAQRTITAGGQSPAFSFSCSIRHVDFLEQRE